MTGSPTRRRPGKDASAADNIGEAVAVAPGRWDLVTAAPER